MPVPGELLHVRIGLGMVLLGRAASRAVYAADFLGILLWRSKQWGWQQLLQLLPHYLTPYLARNSASSLANLLRSCLLINSGISTTVICIGRIARG